MAKNELRRRFVSVPSRDRLAEQLIERRIPAGGPCGRIVDDLILEADPEPQDGSQNPPHLTCTICGEPIEDPGLAMIAWNRELTTIHIAHKGRCLDKVDLQFNREMLSWELSWITDGSNSDLLNIGDLESRMERLVVFLAHLLTHYAKKEPNDFWSVLNDLIMYCRNAERADVRP